MGEKRQKSEMKKTEKGESEEEEEEEGLLSVFPPLLCLLPPFSSV